MLTPDLHARWRAAAPFVITGVAAVVAGGLVAAAVAHQPTQKLVWMAAYLVLIVGVIQCAFGAGQALLSARPPRVGLVGAEWAVFNLGNAGVIVGTLGGRFALVFLGTLCFAAGIALFLSGTRSGRFPRWLLAYRVLLGLIFASSLVGLGLSVASNLA